VWHGTCFNCTTCQLKLTLKSFKGANGQPYCAAHVPAHKANFVPQALQSKVAAAGGSGPSQTHVVSPTRTAPAAEEAAERVGNVKLEDSNIGSLGTQEEHDVRPVGSGRGSTSGLTGG
jgi:hypothetical protein